MTSLLDTPGICIRPWTHATVSRQGANICCFSKTELGQPWSSWGGPFQGTSWDWFKSGEVYTNAREAMLHGGWALCCGRGSTCHIPRDLPTPRQQLVELHRAYPLRRDVVAQVEEDICRGKTQGLGYPPLVCQATVGYRCNRECPFCIQDQHPGDRLGDRPDLAEDELATLGVSLSGCASVRLSGGEVLVYPDDLLWLLLKPLEDAGVRLGLTTNGVGLTPSRYYRLSEVGPVKGIDLSLDTLDPQGYRLSRGGDVKVVRRNVEGICSLWPRHCINTCISVLTMWCRGTTEELVRWCHDVGIRRLMFNPVLGSGLERRGLGDVNPFNRETQRRFPTETAELREELAETYQVAEDLGVEMVYPWRVLAELGSGG